MVKHGGDSSICFGIRGIYYIKIFLIREKDYQDFSINSNKRLGLTIINNLVTHELKGVYLLKILMPVF